MKKFDGWLLCTDIDGTLVDDNQVLSDKNVEAINYFKEQGGRFTFASGRHIYSILDRMEKIMPTLPIVVVNGCAVYNILKKEYEYCDYMKNFKEVVKFLEKEYPSSGIELTMQDGTVFYRENNATRRHHAEEKLTNMQVVKDLDILPDKCFKVMVAQEEEETEFIAENIKSSLLYKKYTTVKSYKWYYEFFNTTANKKNGLDFIVKEYGLDRNKTIAIGDNYNDIEMLQYARISAAPENAEADVKSCADFITRNNNESAICDLIEKLDIKFKDGKYED